MSSGVRIGPGQLTPLQVQSEVMSFADTYAELVTQATDAALFARDLSATKRVMANGLKVNSVEGAVRIASSANPVSALLDMTVMVTLQRRVWERHWEPEVFGEIGAPMGRALAQLEEEVWAITSQALDEEQRSALRVLIDQMEMQYEGQVYVTNLRASEFASDRQKTFVNVRGGGSLLSLFALDPLANLSPTTREIAESRQLAERIFFFANRAPQLIAWRTTGVLMVAAALPESERALVSAETAAAAAAQASETLESFRADLADLKTGAIDQASDRFGAESRAAIDQFFDRFALEREAAIDQIAAEQGVLTEALEELRGTVNEATVLSDSLTGAIDSGDRFLQTARTLKDPDNPGRPFDVTEYQAATEAAAEAFRELNETLRTLGGLTAGQDLSDPESPLRVAAKESRAGVESVIDHTFRRAALLILLGGVALFVALAASRIVGARLGAPR
jgi:hypothetical protein